MLYLLRTFTRILSFYMNDPAIKAFGRNAAVLAVAVFLLFVPDEACAVIPSVSELTQTIEKNSDISASPWTDTALSIVSSFTITDATLHQVTFYIQITSITTNGEADWTGPLVVNYLSEPILPGTTEYWWPQLTDPGHYWWRVWTGDADNNFSSTSSVLLNGRAAMVAYKTLFNPAAIEPVSGWGVQDCSLAWGDLENDGDLDIAIMGRAESSSAYRFRVFRNNGDGTIDPAYIEPHPGSGLYSGTLAWGDCNNDGFLDLAVIGYDGSRRFRVYKNNGNGTFDSNFIEPISSWGLAQSSLAWGDCDNDGDLDLAVGGTDGSVYRFRICKNNGDGTFDQNYIEPIVPAYNNLSMKWADFNNDGDLDIILAGNKSGEGRQIKVFRNNGSDDFTDSGFNSGWGTEQGDIACGDVNNDGWMDFAVCGSTDSYSNGNGRGLRVYVSNGDFSFTSVQDFSWGTCNGELAFADLNNDGCLDIAITGHDLTKRHFRTYLNKGDGTFHPEYIEPEPGWGAGGRRMLARGSSLRCADFDNDGDVDIAVSGDDTDTTRKFRIYKSMKSALGSANTVQLRN